MKKLLILVIITVVFGVIRGWLFVGQVSVRGSGCIKSGTIQYTSNSEKGQILVLESENMESIIFTTFFPKYSVGQVVEVEGDCSTGLYFHPEISVVREVSGVMRYISQLREFITTALRKTMHEPHSRLIGGIVFGIKQSLGDEYDAAFRSSGLSHIIVASGYNVTVLISLILSVSFVFGRKIGFFITFVVICLYALLVGMDPPILRAVLMATGLLVAKLLHRQYFGYLWLVFSAAMLVIFDPSLITSLSMQLSFFATLGIIVSSTFWNQKLALLPMVLREEASTTLSAGLFVMPVIAIQLQSFSFVFLLANVMVLPFLSIIMMFGLLGVVISMASIPLAWVFLIPVQMVSKYIYAVANSLS